MIKIKAVLDKEDDDVIQMYSQIGNKWFHVASVHRDFFRMELRPSCDQLDLGNEVFMKLEAME